ncbi:MAG TPA: hypothetical protein VLX92_10020 [Kofleriaceae bacterium]|nr:hypothetical protein [Kofleriaceae bacterium]
MRTVRAYIAGCQKGFALHPLFELLHAAPTLELASRVAPRLAFWVMAFQDLLRLNEQLVTDPELRRIARHHKAEDAGHDRWFVADLERLSAGGLGIAQLFGPDHRATRDAAYALVSEVFRAASDLERIVLLLAVESTGHVFFERMATFASSHAGGEQLRYFSGHHLKVEQAHAVFEQRALATLDAYTLGPVEAARARALVARVYAAFGAMFDGLCVDRASRRRSVREAGLEPARG